MSESKFNFAGVAIALVTAVASVFIFAILAGVSLGLFLAPRSWTRTETQH